MRIKYFLSAIWSFLLLGLSAQAADIKVDDGAAGWTWSRMGSYLDDDAYLGYAHGATNKNGYGQYTFTGTAVKVYGWKGPQGGTLEAFIDGVSKGTISVNTSVEAYNALLFNLTGLSNSKHTIQIVSRSTRWVMLDYLIIQQDVTPTPTPTPVQDPTRYTDERELVVRTIANFSTANDVVSFMDLAKKNNFTMISFAVKQDEDDEVASGTVFYNSAIAPVATKYKSFDVVGTIISEARKRGLKVKAWIPQFHDQVAAKKNPDWAMKALVNGQIVPFQGSDASSPEYFSNPLNVDVQNYQISIIKEFLSLYKVDALAVDWLRFDNYNMDLSNQTRADFSALYGYDPATINFSQNSTKLVQWNEYRMQKVADYAGRVKAAINAVQPGVLFGSYTLPPEFIECGQSAKRLAVHFDFFSPMAYYDDWGYSINWVYDGVLTDLVKEVGTSKTIIPAYNYYWTQSQFQQIYKNVASKFPQIRGGSFFKYGKWLDSDMQKADLGSKK